MIQFPSKILLLLIYVNISIQFNISPVPNYVFRDPALPTLMKKYGSSLFGYSVTLRKSSIIIGAPKAQSNLPSQSYINETGVIYKCTFTDKTCTPFVFDMNGNFIESDLNSRMKDNQLLGFAMDGLTSDDEKIVVCAPQLKSTYQEEYYLHGICYWSPTTSSAKPQSNIITALKNKDMQSMNINGKNAYYYWLGEMGFSVHVNDANNEILMGAPGINNWKGSVIHFKHDDQKEINTGTGEVGPSTDKSRITEVNSTNSEIDEDSYLGYAVSSGHFLKNPRTLFYVASAPQAGSQSGRVYIFSILENKQMKIYKTFDSLQMGEYFGYNILVEDFNNDKLPDLAISAPMYSKTGLDDNGAVYIYINQDNWSFSQPIRIVGNETTSGRFGTSLGKVGDINLDGYNDLAVGAPFEGDGAVYVHLGSSSGLNMRPSQKIVPSKTLVTSNNFMFGHTISRGVDIDQNKYNDVAIGAPEAERVFVYRTYPVGKIISTLDVSKKELKETDRELVVKCCRRVQSVTSIQRDLGMTITLKADYSNGRAKWRENNNKIFETNVTVNSQMKCTEFDLLIEYNPGLVFRPIDIEMEYVVHDQATESSEFCTTCVKIDSTEINYIKETVIYSTGCAGSVCVADLTVKSELVNMKPPFILGSSNALSIKYDVRNLREPAYLPQINITIDNNIASFARIPSSCKLDDTDEKELICDLTKGNPIKTNELQSLTVSIDTTKLEGNDLSISAIVFSSGKESNEADNRITDRIALEEFSHVEITGKSSIEMFTIENIEEPQVNVIHTFEILNHGPSTVQDMSIQIFVPTKYLAKDKKNAVQMIDVNELSIHGNYHGHYLQWTKFSDALPAIGNTRSRRDVKQTRKSKFALDELPSERTINFFCDENGYESNLCVNSLSNVKNFKRGNEPIVVTLNFTLKIKSFESIFNEMKDIFVIQTYAQVKKPLNEKQDSLKVDARQPYTVVFKHVEASTPIWIIIVSVLAGIIILAIITYVLYKLGFFRRKRHADRINTNAEEMELRGASNENE